MDPNTTGNGKTDDNSKIADIVNPVDHNTADGGNTTGDVNTTGDETTTGDDNTTSSPPAQSSTVAAPAEGPAEGPATAPPCPTAPSLTQEEYDRLRAHCEGIILKWPAGSYYTIHESHVPGGWYEIVFRERIAGCPQL